CVRNFVTVLLPSSKPTRLFCASNKRRSVPCRLRFPRLHKKRKTRKPGKVQRIIKPAHRDDTEKAEIAIQGAEHLYKKIRIENTLYDADGNPVKLKQGADVDVVIEADSDSTLPKDK